MAGDMQGRAGHPIQVPESFLAMPRWWSDGDAWLEALPGLVEEMCHWWGLDLDGEPMHGSNALVVPVTRSGEPLALRLAPVDERTASEVEALRFWDGQGVVRLIEADLPRSAMLLERLDGGSTLASLPLEEAIPVIGRLIRRLAVPAPPHVRSTADLVRDRLISMPDEWESLGRPFERATLDLALAGGEAVRETESMLAVNGDIHFEQVLRGEREPWLVVDPVLLRGDIAYDLARVLWTRLDEMADDAAIRHWLAVLVGSAGLDWERSVAWVRFRTVDYWLWGLSHGLTEDPVRCARLIAAFSGKARFGE
jgi:streptomycin 6-kinase